MVTDRMPSLFVLISLLVIAVVIDLRSNRVPNQLVLVGLALGLTSQLFFYGWVGLGNGVLGSLIGFSIFLLMYAVGGMAAGDVKLMAMVGVFLTPSQALGATAASLLAGSVCGLILVCWHGELWLTLKRYFLIFVASSYLAPERGEAAGKRFPYAIAILLGTLGSMLWFEFAR